MNEESEHLYHLRYAEALAQQPWGSLSPDDQRDIVQIIVGVKYRDYQGYITNAEWDRIIEGKWNPFIRYIRKDEKEFILSRIRAKNVVLSSPKVTIQGLDKATNKQIVSAIDEAVKHQPLSMKKAKTFAEWMGLN